MTPRRLRVLRVATVAALAVATIGPLAWIALASVMTRAGILRGFPLPGEIDLENYRQLAVRLPIGDHLRTTIVLAGVSALAATLIGVPTAYYISRGRGGGPRWLFGASLGLWLVPPVALSLQVYFWFVDLGWFDRLPGLLLLHTALDAALVVVLSVAFFELVPLALDEKAWIDGLRGMALIRRIHWPLLGPALVGFGLLAFVESWNEFLLAGILTDDRARPLSVDIFALTTGTRVEWGQVAALAVINLIPLPVGLLAFQVVRWGRRRLAGLEAS